MKTQKNPIGHSGAGDGERWPLFITHTQKLDSITALIVSLTLALMLTACSKDSPKNTLYEEIQPTRTELSEQKEEKYTQDPKQGKESVSEFSTRNNEPLAFDFDSALAALQHISVEIGPRVKTTAGEKRAADYIASQFKLFGYAVERQKLPILISEIRKVTLILEGWSIPTNILEGSPGGLITGPLVVVPGTGAESDYADLDMTGAVALVERGEIFFQEKVTNAEKAGAQAIVIYNNEPGPFNGSIAGPLLSSDAIIPALTITKNDGLALKKQNGSVITVEVDIKVDIRESENVIAKTVGKKCEIYVGGHYDSVPNVSGANDNASGTALVIELARTYKGSDGADVVCFVAFGAEEGGGGTTGMNGSYFLVKQLQNRGETRTVRAMMNLDAIGAGNSIVLIGTPSLTTMGLPLAQSYIQSASIGEMPPGTGSDHVNFDKVGIPVIFPSVWGATLHTPSDNFTNLDHALFNTMGSLVHGLLRCLIAQKSPVSLSGIDCLTLNTNN